MMEATPPAAMMVLTFSVVMARIDTLIPTCQAGAPSAHQTTTFTVYVTNVCLLGNPSLFLV
jgi:hypothetical protein